jgi:ribonuclease T1
MMRKMLKIILSLLLLTAFSCRTSEKKQLAPPEAYSTLQYILQNNKAPSGYVGGRKFGNYEELLPKKTSSGKRIYYKEWDIYPKIEGKNRGPHRLVTGNNKTAYYTPDHYNTFIQIYPDDKNQDF